MYYIMLTVHRTLTNYARRFAFSKKKRVRQLNDERITFPNENQQLESSGSQEMMSRSYTDVHAEVNNLEWQHMSFDRLCALPQKTLQAIEIQIKKDKFNVSDKQFYDFATDNLGVAIHKNALPQLNPYYRSVWALLANRLDDYSNLHPNRQLKKKYLGQIYVFDPREDRELKTVIDYFINNLQFPGKLEAIAEPSLVKRLLSLKRELMVQGVYFESQADLKQTKKKQRELQKQRNELIDNFQNKNNEQIEQQLLNQDEENQQQARLISEVQQEMSLSHRMESMRKEILKYTNKVQIVDVIGYEYEFWVDVKHNRNKNGVQEDYIVEQREINNPNETTILTSKYPKVKVKYIIHKKKRKDYAMHFCTKVELLVKINKEHARIVKVEWNGPSDKQIETGQHQFKVIDYQFIMNGNPTIKNVFDF